MPFAVLGRFFKKHARESSSAKASLGAFPPIHFALKNKELKLAKDVRTASHVFFHAQIYNCFDEFNCSQGTVITLQRGAKLDMAKAIILAIYCDHPAAIKCCLCGSACPQCFTIKVDMRRPPIDGIMQNRTPAAVPAKKIIIRQTPKKLAAKGEIIAMGVNMDIDCAWIGDKDQDGFTPFRPDNKKDNIFQNLHQVLKCMLKCMI